MIDPTNDFIVINKTVASLSKYIYCIVNSVYGTLGHMVNSAANNAGDSTGLG